MKILDVEREKTYDLYFGFKYIKTLTVSAYDPLTKASALCSINRLLEDEKKDQIPFTRLNILKTHFIRTR